MPENQLDLLQQKGIEFKLGKVEFGNGQLCIGIDPIAFGLKFPQVLAIARNDKQVVPFVLS